MSGLGARTKKVTTYGKKKTQIISIHSDISKPIVPSSPLPSHIQIKTKRPVLQTKLSNDISNLPSTPLPPSKINKAKSKIIEDEVQPISVPSSPEIIFKAHKRVNRPGKVVIPRSSISSPPSASAIKTKPRSRKSIPEVVIPTSRKVKPLGELTKQFKEISIEDAPLSAAKDISPIEDSQIALDDLLSTCSSATIGQFTNFLEGCQLPEYGSIRKVGEASYSEVFGLVVAEEVEFVLKVIPLLSSMRLDKTDGPMPDCTKMEDVKREIEVTKRMSQVPGGGFVQYIGSYVVEGVYPQQLLEQWDEYKGTEGSASVRPSALSSTQKYCLLLLSHAGTDLETFKFSQTQGWLQAAGVFWQIVSSLARAERWTEFEHRDLHEGQILIHPSKPTHDDDEKNYLNPSASGVQTTIIDFGLSRLTIPVSDHSDSVWTEIPKEVYEGKGAQWDSYRLMRDKVESEKGMEGWKGFNPITNVMWLQYILTYMLNTKLPRQLRQPNRRSSRAIKTYEREERAMNILQQAEKLLGWSIDIDKDKKRKGLRGQVEYGEEDRLKSAKDILDWGVREGWVTIETSFMKTESGF
nr:HASPIN protein kinase [Kwoniella mangroviensis CBS 8507]OCF63636.1 HASPIN protein kinase [Kwoniella mangroviensis CBS 8507]